MKVNYIILGLLLFLLHVGNTRLYAQTTQNGFEVYLGIGGAGMNLGDGVLADSGKFIPVNMTGNSVPLVGANFRLGLSPNFSLGLGLGWSQYQLSNDSALNISSVGPLVGSDMINSPYDQYGQLQVSGSNIKETMTLSGISIPLFLEAQGGSGDLHPYGRLGIAITIDPSGTFENTGGTAGFEGKFTDIPREESSGTFDVLIQDVEKLGFSAGEGLAENGAVPLSLNSAFLAFQASGGLRYDIGKLYLFGELFFHQSADVSNYNPNDNRYSLSSGPGDYNTLLSGVENATINNYGLKVGAGLNFGGDDDDNPKQPRNAQSVPLEYVQKVDTRRNENEPDPEFVILAPEMASGLAFKPSGNKVSYDKLTQQLMVSPGVEPQDITVSYRGKNNVMNMDPFDSKYSASDEAYNLVLTPSNNFSLTLSLEDVDTESEVNGFTVDVKLGGESLFPPRTMNSGGTIYKLYNHPLVRYQVTLSHPCYPTKSFNVTSADFKTPKVIQAESEGEAEEILFDISSSVTDLLRVQGSIIKSRRKTPLSGTISDGEVSLFAGCGEDPGTNYQLELEKPLGYDLFTGSSSKNWKAGSITVNMSNGKPTQTLKLEPVPSYHLVYIDISEATNRNLFRKPVLSMVRGYNSAKEGYMVYLSNGQSPNIAENASDFRIILRNISQIFPDLPKAGVDRQALLDRMKGKDLFPERQIVNLHFFLSRTLYETSREQLINQLTAAYPQGRENIRIFIHTDFEVPQSMKLEQGLYKTPVEYILLK